MHNNYLAWYKTHFWIQHLIKSACQTNQLIGYIVSQESISWMTLHCAIARATGIMKNGGPHYVAGLVNYATRKS